jgi:hypothetical protein
MIIILEFNENLKLLILILISQLQNIIRERFEYYFKELTELIDCISKINKR